MAETTRPTTPLPPVSRRGFLFSLGLALNAAAAALFAVPVVGFLFSPARRLAQQAWIPLGSVESFPEGQTRLATYRNPFVQPWDGETANVPCWVRRIAAEFQVFAINAPPLSQALVSIRSFMRPVTAASTMPTVHASGHRRAACSSTPTR